MKENELKVTDLMVGDWVSCQINSIEIKYVQVAAVNKTSMNGIPSDFLEFNKVTLDMLDGHYIQVDINSIKPVPITKELLEKNGFDVLNEIYFYILRGIDNRVEMRNDKEYMNTNSEWYVHVDSEDYRTIASCELTYLHELQALLNLCKIEHEWQV